MSCYIVGAGAQGRVIAEIWAAQEPEKCLYFLDDDPTLHGREVSGSSILGPVEMLSSVVPGSAEAVLGIGDNTQRLRLAAAWESKGIAWAKVIHPTAAVFPSTEIGAGTVVFAQAVVSSEARVGRHAIINSGVIAEHDCVIDDGASLGPGVCMGGRVQIGRGTFVSTGVTIAPRVSIGAGSVIGAGAVVVEDIPSGVLAYGIPARVVRDLGEGFHFGRLL